MRDEDALDRVLQHEVAELVPGAEGPDDFAAVAQGDEEFLCGPRRVSSRAVRGIESAGVENVLSVRSSRLAAVVNICGGSCGIAGGGTEEKVPRCGGPGPALSWMERFSMGVDHGKRAT